ncbi:SEC14-like protein 2 [Biomphalaria glabrata]|uniref:SEC14-like protein 2 n=1 Tax=Biomphalaria glabrata TaxID=6526 RepID=A0A2C9JYA2_BIOGL|nr:SEC14-like protein 2 [Biomphalaria glabrata]XP_013088646.1 SEC14-like protein 2 [Biomphalaria glabrata]XP_055862458.1 SEC14-like protein 2 [Biomphalaria glabrata]KAI8753006.1 SEC14-like protein 2 [Biomphalaria glabrata]
MSGHVGSLSDKQAAILEEFRQNVSDLLKPHHDDYYLLRWLRARKFDLKKSEAMLRNHFRWREENNVDTILEDFQPPEVMKKYYPGGLFGQDKEGSLIWVDPTGYIDLKGLLMSIKKQDILKSKIQLLEEFYKLFDILSEKQGRRVDQIVILFDLEKFGLKHLWKPGIDVFTDILTIFEDNYPETLKRTYVLNAPRVFPIAFNLIKPFLSEETVRKVTICGANYKEVLLQHIDADQLPAHWGGTCVDPDGNPRCPSKINPGGEVPKSYYQQNNIVDLTGFTEATVGRGSSLQLDFSIDEVGSALRWQFKTDGFDIGFGIYRRTEDKKQKAGDMEPIITSQKVNSHMFPEEGSMHCKHPGTYIVRFDNTHSWVRSKKLYYLIEILKPDTQDFVLPKVESDASLASSLT